MNDRMDYFIGQQLKERRLELKYSMQDVGNYMGTSKVTIYNYENGISSLSISNLIKMCGFLRTDYVQVIEKAKKEYYGEKIQD